MSLSCWKELGGGGGGRRLREEGGRGGGGGPGGGKKEALGSFLLQQETSDCLSGATKLFPFSVSLWILSDVFFCSF